MAAQGKAVLGVGMMLTFGLGLARAQMVLPGAVESTPAGNSTPAPAPTSRPKAKGGAAPAGAGERVTRGTAVAVPGPAALAGRTLVLDGGGSQIVFAPADKSAAVAKLTLAGEKISNSSETCRLEVSPAPGPPTSLGRPDGLDRFRVEVPACPMIFDVLDGAILVPNTQATCDFTAADCRVRTTGLWGPTPGELGPDRVKSLERARGAAEAAVRSNYKALVASTKDRPTIMGFARDQAQFSSSRSETCRDYADEGRHGYCATKFTEARAAFLYDRLGVALAEKAARKAKRRAGKQGRREP